ncbi:MAG: hypothetical protein KGN79_10450 [Acidobacteriota bacterium]|nr:hypothetical protein [Acidobacteriota bacterium]
MKADRYFFSATAFLFLFLMLWGFHSFVHGRGFQERPIDPSIIRLDAAHGIAIALWFVLFLAQSLLIATRNRKVHMTLGWSVVVLGPAIAILGTMVAYRSVKLTPEFIFFNMWYSHFLLSMFVEMLMFSVFVTAGVFTRKQPRIHRTMMLMTSLALIPGALARNTLVASVFGDNRWMGLFAPALILAGVLLAIRSAMTRTFDRWFASSWALLSIAYIGSTYLCETATWDHIATAMLR